jgi:hypothetical protein
MGKRGGSLSYMCRMTEQKFFGEGCNPTDKRKGVKVKNRRIKDSIKHELQWISKKIFSLNSL